MSTISANGLRGAGAEPLRSWAMDGPLLIFSGGTRARGLKSKLATPRSYVCCRSPFTNNRSWVGWAITSTPCPLFFAFQMKGFQ